MVMRMRREQLSTEQKMGGLLLVFATAFLLLASWSVSRFLIDYYRKWRFVQRLPKWETYPPHWFWGHLDSFNPDEESMLRMNRILHENNLKVSAGWIGPIFAAITVCHPDTIKQVLKQPKQSNVYDLLLPWLGKSLLTLEDGPKWHRNRRLLTPAFHYAILKGYVSVYNRCLQHLFEKWDASARAQNPVLLFDTLCPMSLDIILQCAFSFQSNCQKEGVKPAYIKGVYELVERISERFFNPLYQIDWIYFLTPAGRRMKAACKIVHEHAEMVINERRSALGLDGKGEGVRDLQNLLNGISNSRQLDFLDILLTAVDDKGVGLTDREIRNEVDTFMFAGHDTTTTGISWTLYCLARHPEHQEKVRDEVRRVLDGRDQLEYEDLKELHYTQWCIKESMRLYPPVFIIFRETGEEIEVDGQKIPKGVWIAIVMYFLHHNPNVWPNPEEFDPLRFKPNNAKDRDPYAFLAFSAGSRNCIGQNFAINEEKVVVASVVNRYRLSVVEDHEVKMLPLGVMRAKNDIKLNLEPLVN